MFISLGVFFFLANVVFVKPSQKIFHQKAADLVKQLINIPPNANALNASGDDYIYTTYHWEDSRISYAVWISNNWKDESTKKNIVYLTLNVGYTRKSGPIPIEEKVDALRQVVKDERAVSLLENTKTTTAFKPVENDGLETVYLAQNTNTSSPEIEWEFKQSKVYENFKMGFRGVFYTLFSKYNDLIQPIYGLSFLFVLPYFLLLGPIEPVLSLIFLSYMFVAAIILTIIISKLRSVQSLSNMYLIFALALIIVSPIFGFFIASTSR